MKELRHGQINPSSSGLFRPVVRKIKSAFGKYLLPSVVVLGLTFGPVSSLADGPKPSVKVAQVNGNGTKKELHPDLAKLPKVSLKDMTDLAKKSEQYQNGDAETRTGFSTSVRVVFDKNVLYAGVNICYIHGCASRVAPVEDKLIVVAVNGEGIASIDLAELDRLYRLATKSNDNPKGKELRYVRLVVDIFESKYSQYGTGIAIEVVPVEESQGEIQSGIPTMFTTYYTKARQATEEQYRLIE